MTVPYLQTELAFGWTLVSCRFQFMDCNIGEYTNIKHNINSWNGETIEVT